MTVTVDGISLMNQLIGQDPQSIELLPGHWSDWVSAVPTNPPNETFPFVFVEGNLGIPQKTLYQLYVRSLDFPRSPTPAQFKRTLEKTSCIILANPAHQTALNARKRLVLHQFLDPLQELRFTRLLLRGIKTCAKESVLWDHRRWCLRQVDGVPNHASLQCSEQATFQENSAPPHIYPKAFEEEFATIRTACSLYPRNYHAWSHWHYIFNCCLGLLRYGSLVSDDHDQLLFVMLEEYQKLHEWVAFHVSDYSAIHHLLLASHLLCGLSTLSSSAETKIRSVVKSPSALADHFWTLLSSYPSHESLFLGLRHVLPRLSDGERELYREKIADLSESVPWRNFSAFHNE